MFGMILLSVTTSVVSFSHSLAIVVLKTHKNIWIELWDIYWYNIWNLGQPQILYQAYNQKPIQKTTDSERRELEVKNANPPDTF